MTREELRARDLTRLSGVKPELAEKVLKLLNAFDELGFPLVVTDTLRTTEQQQALYKQGRTFLNGQWVKTGPTVTNADGIQNVSNHQRGIACDVAFLDAHNQPTWADDLPWSAMGYCAKALGLRWGGDWPSLRDLPHLELAPTE